MRLTEEDRQRIENLLRVSELARANFPRTTYVRIETCGVDPRAEINIPSSLMEALCRAALAQSVENKK